MASTFPRRRLRIHANLGLDHTSVDDDGQPPESVVKKCGLPAMLKALREKRSTLKTANAHFEEDGAGDTKLKAVDENENRIQRFLDISDLEKKIIRQVEYYFGDFNLPKDRFMQEQMDPEGWISMDVMITFKRLKELSLDVDLIMEALSKSLHKIVQVDFAGRQIRRYPDNPLPDDNEAQKLDIQSRTVFVTGFHRQQTSLDDLLEFFENGKFGKVSAVKRRLRRKTKDEENHVQEDRETDDRRFLGSVFVTFDNIQGAKDFIMLTKTEEGVSFGNRKLLSKFQKDFFDKRIENNDEFSPEKVTKTVYVQGFDKTDLSDQDVANFFSMFEGAETVKKRVYRDNNSQEDHEGQWKFSGSVFVCFDTVKAAKNFIKLHEATPVTYNGDSLKVKTQLEYYIEKGKFRRRINEFQAGSE